jgi:hypothetical protein
MNSMWRPTSGGSCNGCQPETTSTTAATTTPATVNGQYGGWRSCLHGNEVIVFVFRAEMLTTGLLLSAHPGNSTS